MAQKLILPINNMRINVGYKSPKYLTDPTTSGLGIHYGQDLVVASNATRNDRNYIYASGVGKVIKAGWDNLFGYVVVVVYYGAKYGASYKDLTVRYFHMDSVSVTTNQNVTKDTKLGVAIIMCVSILSSMFLIYKKVETSINEKSVQLKLQNFAPTEIQMYIEDANFLIFWYMTQLLHIKNSPSYIYFNLLF